MRALTDAMLATLAQTGDARAEDELMRRHERMATGAASLFRLPGGDREDVCQEARVGLLRAIREFDLNRGVPFKNFARMAIQRQLITSLKAAQRFKHGPLTDSVRDALTGDGVSVEALDTVADSRADVHRIVEGRDAVRQLHAAVATLTPLERHWLTVVMNDGEYSARDRGVRNKVSENAVDRARAKIRKRLAA